MTALIYKIVTAAAWDAARQAGRFDGAPVDLKDGYIHFSTAAQVRETAAKHFAGIKGLVLAAFDPQTLGEKLTWEPSRGGALFPHLYAALDPALAVWVKPLPVGPDGAHSFPGELA
jgi:uncharacterized protein (DUF952 family)